jgi:hypothetical protein
MGNLSRMAAGLFRAKTFKLPKLLFDPSLQYPPLPTLPTLGFVDFFRVANKKFINFIDHRIRIRNNHPRRAHSISFKPVVLLFAAPSLSYFIMVAKAYVQLRSFSMSDVYVFILGRGARL